jgi:hypothetical protein
LFFFKSRRKRSAAGENPENVPDAVVGMATTMRTIL